MSTTLNDAWGNGNESRLWLYKCLVDDLAKDFKTTQKRKKIESKRS